MGKGKEKPQIECSMSYALIDESERKIAAGECKGTIDKEYPTMFPKFGNILPFHLTDISQIETKKLQNHVAYGLKGKELVNETVKKPDVDMEFIYYDETGKEK